MKEVPAGVPRTGKMFFSVFLIMIPLSTVLLEGMAVISCSSTIKGINKSTITGD